MDQILSLDFLMTNLGAIAFITMIVQYTKSFVPEKIPTRLYVLALSMVLLVGVTVFINPTISGFILAVLNSFIVATACMGAYDLTYAKVDAAKKLLEKPPV